MVVNLVDVAWGVVVGVVEVLAVDKVVYVIDVVGLLVEDVGLVEVLVTDKVLVFGVVLVVVVVVAEVLVDVVVVDLIVVVFVVVAVVVDDIDVGFDEGEMRTLTHF